MRILGIDPGLRITGYGVVDIIESQQIYVASGVIRSTWRSKTCAAVPPFTTST